jgi:hypothetical protein
MIMSHDARIAAQSLKRLQAAIGYQELGMTAQAIRCLERVIDIDAAGPFRAVAQSMRAWLLDPESDDAGTFYLAEYFARSAHHAASRSHSL